MIESHPGQPFDAMRAHHDTDNGVVTVSFRDGSEKEMSLFSNDTFQDVTAERDDLRFEIHEHLKLKVVRNEDGYIAATLYEPATPSTVAVKTRPGCSSTEVEVTTLDGRIHFLPFAYLESWNDEHTDALMDAWEGRGCAHCYDSQLITTAHLRPTISAVVAVNDQLVCAIVCPQAFEDWASLENLLDDILQRNGH